MAFRMNRPIIKGTANHKASIAKAKSESIVAQTRTKADPSLTWAGEQLGKSNIPQAIDYTTDQPEVKVPEKKELTEEEKAARDAKRAERKAAKDARKQARKDRKAKKDAKKARQKRHDDRRLSTSDSDAANQRIYDNLTKRKDSRGLTDKEQEALDKATKRLGIKDPKVKKEKDPKVKKEKEPKEKKDTWYNDVDKDGNVISRGWQSIKDKIKAKREQNELDFQAKQEEKNRIQSEKDAANLEADKLKQAELNKELEAKNKLKEAKTTASTDYTVNKRDLVLKGGNWVPKEGAVSKEDDHAIWDGEQWTDNPKYMDKLEGVDTEGRLIDREKEGSVAGWDDAKFTKEIIGGKMGGKLISGEGVSVEAIGEKQVKQYSKEQKKRLTTEGVWSEDAKKIVLPEEIVDGEFVSQAKGEIIVSKEIDKALTIPTSTTETTKPVVEEKKTLSNREKREKKLADRKWNNPNTGQHVKDQMLREGYVPNESKSPMEMRDDRIYRHAIKGGPVRKNMIKGGYIPPNER